MKKRNIFLTEKECDVIALSLIEQIRLTRQSLVQLQNLGCDTTAVSQTVDFLRSLLAQVNGTVGI